MEWGVSGVAVMWLVVVVSSLSAATSIAVLGRKSWGRGLGAVIVALLLLALAAALQIQSDPVFSCAEQSLDAAVFSAALCCLVIALRQFRQLPLPWWQLCIAPALTLVLCILPPVMHDWMAGIFMAQISWMAAELWRMRALRLGLGYRMLCAAAAIYLLGVPLLKWGLGQALLADIEYTQSLWYGVKVLCLVAMVLLVALGFMRMEQDRRDARSRRAALRDPLTRILNRRALIRVLERCLRDAISQVRPVALLLIDVDHFKRVNDTHGHIAGDKVLSHISRVLARSVRADSFVGRFGGEEFVVICPDTALEEAHILATRLNASVRNASVQIKGQVLQVTVSIGGYAGNIPAGTAWETVLEAADSAMYRAKDAGRDRVVMQRELPQAVSSSSILSWFWSR